VNSSLSFMKCTFEYSYSKNVDIFVTLNASSLDLAESNIIGLEFFNEYTQLPKDGNFLVSIYSKISFSYLNLLRVYIAEVIFGIYCHLYHNDLWRFLFFRKNKDLSLRET
jgi:hypothetical protein